MLAIIFPIIFLLLSLAEDDNVVVDNGMTVKVIMDDTKVDGRPWDGAGAGGPDPFIVVEGVSYYGKRCQDSYTCKFTITNDDPVISIEVWDADAVANDFAGTTICTAGAVCETGKGAVVLMY